jgi:hypothetical protein
MAWPAPRSTVLGLRYRRIDTPEEGRQASRYVWLAEDQYENRYRLVRIQDPRQWWILRNPLFKGHRLEALRAY